ncbi:SMP-30/gluconolactonase/LRE family protein [Actinobacteria bacterium YIM 96077]|uniref:SMP-30/gluconolactonase/LRE family protein n=1 Tax=Phytoactinopolyspora halophila TaxID=1981511 RepID=A0A329R285_9ACTN|nr:SMP-30/gluconolactonase/LRE family protein [Phytoactinopolyspora halophila]AYY13169.1 SMP-30/gluconolactonase/LRE family protein [Actinobacteria bacterium YIM 96077]RAW17592.1 SMP-30/gluconolactonase/LRE family protein [Phytoactinopolyspora halophila]
MSQPVPITEPVALGEGPLWDPDTSKLMWVDISQHAVHEYDPATGDDRVVQYDVPVGAIVKHAHGGYVAAAGMGFAAISWPGGELAWLGDVTRGERMNDGACDPVGRFLAGTMVTGGGTGAALYQLDRGHVRLLLEYVSISNGLDWSPDGQTMYYVDTPCERVDAFRYDVETGSISARRTLIDLRDTPGRPDGLTVDADGGIWVAMARGGGCVRRFTPDGDADDVIELPVPHATSLAFGGDDLRDLYITTSQLGLDADDLRHWPLAGASFLVSDVGVTGREPFSYVP